MIIWRRIGLGWRVGRTWRGVGNEEAALDSSLEVPASSEQPAQRAASASCVVTDGAVCTEQSARPGKHVRWQ